MRWNLVRTEVRWLMFTIAIAAIVFWIGARNQRFQRIAAYHESRKPTILAGDAGRRMIGNDTLDRPVTDSESEWHRLMAQKYRRAARRPWCPVTPARSVEQYCDEFGRVRQERLLLFAQGLQAPPPGLEP